MPDTCSKHAALESDLREIKATVHRIETALTGAVDGSVTGVQARLASLERAEANRTRLMVACITSAVTGLATAAWQFFTLRR